MNYFKQIFDIVKNNLLVENFNYNSKYVFEREMKIEARGKYPQGVISYLTNQGALKIANVKIEAHPKGGRNYVIEFTDVNLDSPFFRTLKKMDKKDNLKFNDEFRADDNRYYSNGNIVGYDAYYCDETKYEKLSREDSCVFELFAQWLGYNNYQDFIDNNKRSDEEIDMLYTKFREGALASDWMIGEEEEIEIA
jgi:hypothetical protein